MKKQNDYPPENRKKQVAVIQLVDMDNKRKWFVAPKVGRNI